MGLLRVCIHWGHKGKKPCPWRMTLRRMHRCQDGFTIIEILAALALLAVVTAGAVPLFISGIRSSLASRFETQAKNLALERLEVMRNLPYYAVSSTSSAPATCSDPARSSPKESPSGPVVCDYKDLLDTYYRSATWQATSTGTGGYVSTTTTQSADEIAAGLIRPYYRYVLDPIPNYPQGRFSQVIVSQFLDASTTPLSIVTPLSNYNTQNPTTDPPPSRLLGVTVITRWQIGAQSEKYVTFSQIAEGAAEPTVLSLVSDATAVAIRSAKNFDDPLRTDDDPGRIDVVAGISRSQATLAGAANASTYAQGGFAALGGVPSIRKEGVYRTASAPPPSTSEGGSPGVTLTTGTAPTTYEWGRLRSTQTSPNPASVGVDPSQPSVPATNAGSGTNWSKGTLNSATAPTVGDYDLTFNNGQQPPVFGETPPGRMNDLLPSTVAHLVTLQGAGTTDSANGQTYLKSQAGAGHFAESGAKAAMQEIRLVPTAFAPEGIVKVSLTSASLKCVVPPRTATPPPPAKVDVEFSGELKYYSQLNSNAVANYVRVPFSSATSGAPLPDLATPIAATPSQRTLGNYIKSWSILPSATTTIGTTTAPNTLASSSLDGIVRIVTQNTRPPQLLTADDNSAVELRVGILSCSAEDRRP